MLVRLVVRDSLCGRGSLAAVTSKSHFSGFSNEVYFWFMEQSGKGFLVR